MIAVTCQPVMLKRSGLVCQTRPIGCSGEGDGVHFLLTLVLAAFQGNLVIVII